ncbi:TPA: DUF2955 domain-containing protein [Vibrio vulnificus]|nr:DUF2955 domain-containing protein [Vibrio vulnificus]
MFRSAANPVLRLVLAPSILLFYLSAHGAILPILAPIFVVIFLTIMPSKPPVDMLIKLLAVMVFVSLGVVLLGEQLIDSPTGYGLYCWALLFWSFYRSHENTKDILATFVLLVVIMMSVINLQFGISSFGLPALMLEASVIALIVTYFSFLLFPGDEKEIKTDEEDPKGANSHLGLIFFKSIAMALVMVALIASGSSQSILIGITISSMIRVPFSDDHRLFSRNRITTTAIGILFTLPMVLLSIVGWPTWALFGATLFLGLQLACFAMRQRCRMSIYQLLFTNFFVLVSQVLNYQGDDPFSSHLTRLISIATAILIGYLILNLTQTTSHYVVDKVD